MSDNFYLDAMRNNTVRYHSELNEIRDLLKARNLSPLEYRAAERSLQISIEASIGIAKHWCKHLAGFSPAEAYQSFEYLSQKGVLSLDELTNWRKIVGLRNALVHDYLNIDPEIVRSIILQEHYQALFIFIKQGIKALS